MRCPACGFENASGIKFCGECGASLKLRCPSCGFENAPAIKFCGDCGTPLATTAKEPAQSDPRSYTPKHLAEKILTSPLARMHNPAGGEAIPIFRTGSDGSYCAIGAIGSIRTIDTFTDARPEFEGK
jgi:hypothetical protein